MYKYYNNKEWVNGKSPLMAEIKANNILEADKLFEEKTGFNVIKCPWIGLVIDFQAPKH